MTRYLLDTNHASAHWKGHPLLSARITTAQDAEFWLSLPTIGELWFMVFNSNRVDENRARMIEFIDQFQAFAYNNSVAVEFGRLRTELRKLGRGISGIDAQIAAIARLNGVTLLTADHDFDAVPSLRIENWLV